MKKRPKQAHLQNRILLYIEYSKVNTLAELARELGAQRSSVSRAMHALRDIRLVTKTDGYWSLTPAGEEEVRHVKRRLPERTTKAAETVNRALKQARIIALASDAERIDEATPFTVVSDAAFSTLREAAEAATQPLFNAAISVDLLTSVKESMQSLTSLTAEIDSISLRQTTLQPLLSAATGVDLLTSAQESMQSVISLTARLDSTGLGQSATQPLVSAAIAFDSVISAQEAILPVVDAAVKFDSIGLSQAFTQALSDPSLEFDSILSAQDAILPLMDAAVKFDSTVQPGESPQFLNKALDGIDLLESAQVRLIDFTSLTADFLSDSSPVEIINSTHLSSVLESINIHSLKPTINEIAASQVLDVMEDYSQSILKNIGPPLAQEALVSFSQSRQLSLSSIEQLSGMGSQASLIIKDLSEADLGLTRIVSSLENISMQDFTAQTIFGNVITQMPNVAEIGRTYKGYLADLMVDLGTGVTNHMTYSGIMIPTMTSSTYIGSVEAAFFGREPMVRTIDSPEGFGGWSQDESSQIEDVFRTLGPGFAAMWHGSWTVLYSDSPDRIRQAAHSGRELLMQTLAKLAPDISFDRTEIEKYGHNGKVTRKMRMKKIMASDSKSKLIWANAVAKALDETYRRLVTASHDRGDYPQATERQIAGLLQTLGGLLLFIEDVQNQHFDE